MAHRFTIVIRPNDQKNLIVEDAMKQILDAFELLRRTSDDETVEWRIVDARTNSPPLRLTVESISPSAPKQVSEFEQSARELKAGVLPEAWDDQFSRDIARRLFLRTQLGVGLVIEAANDSIIWEDKDAPAALRAIDVTPERPSLRTKSQMGSIEGELVSITKYRGDRPAVRLLERKTGSQILCELSPELTEELGHQELREVWKNKRVTIRGLITYKKNGRILRVKATSASSFVPSGASEETIFDPSFTGGLGAEEYLRRLRDGEIG